ncbi:hypothetical protein CJ205_00610 [Dolosicoccus paucivorans]|uniref:Farnesyl diphosphate synthase n=1 Tax=Dolosicoccus paucivorans TaxID=84521 RepID=A0A2N6SQA0_9LACT|nr:farnesyl diphosphate synthase [Dolosicoccus paucivorans]PMB84656.1 hypothetical protein CJ206_02605 [Dolosicoccus paucivorans]PMC59240.1 hypothetical protein CJ205_00610 [Dolosicoccus paucivorans]
MTHETLQAHWQRYLTNWLKQQENTRLLQSMEYSLNNGGKRLRPMLLLMTALIKSSEAAENALPVATALEYIHTSSLIHDDLPAMDNDDYRRGKLTNHKQFDEATAILAGDALLIDSFNLITNATGLTAEQRLACVQILSKAAGSQGMIEGQMIDMASSTTMSVDDLRQMHFLKTGQLFIAAIEMACVIANFNDTVTKQLIQFATHFGVAFQIHNDLLDGLKEGTGSDEVNDKGTYVTLLGAQESKKQLADERQKAQNILKDLSQTTSYSFEPLNYFLDFLQDPTPKASEVSYE